MTFLQNLGSNWAAVDKCGLVLLALGVATVWMSRFIAQMAVFRGHKDAQIYIRFVGLMLAMAGTLWAILG